MQNIVVAPAGMVLLDEPAPKKARTETSPCSGDANPCLLTVCAHAYINDFCSSCGEIAEPPSRVNCVRCSAQIEMIYRFCPHCRKLQ